MSRYPGTSLTPERLYELLSHWGFPADDVLVSTAVGWTGADQEHIENLVVQLFERGLVETDLELGEGGQRPTVITSP